MFGVRNAQEVWEQERLICMRRGLFLLSDFTNPIIRQILMELKFA